MFSYEDQLRAVRLAYAGRAAPQTETNQSRNWGTQ